MTTRASWIAVLVVAACAKPRPPAPLSNSADTPSEVGCNAIPEGEYLCDLARSVDELVAGMGAGTDRCTVGANVRGEQALRVRSNRNALELVAVLTWLDGAVHVDGRLTCADPGCDHRIGGALELSDAVVYNGDLVADQPFAAVLRLEHVGSEAFMEGDAAWDGANLCARK